MSVKYFDSLSLRLFVQQFVQAYIKENFNAQRHWPFASEIHHLYEVLPTYLSTSLPGVVAMGYGGHYITLQRYLHRTHTQYAVPAIYAEYIRTCVPEAGIKCKGN